MVIVTNWGPFIAGLWVVVMMAHVYHENACTYIPFSADLGTPTSSLGIVSQKIKIVRVTF